MADKKKLVKPAPVKPTDKQQYIFRPWRTTPDGKVLFARDYGLRAWKIPVTNE